jgi:hypothetical protein
MKQCECEHIAHFPDEQAKTPNGNIGHSYGKPTGELTPIKTEWGTFKVCLDCASDCLGHYAKS